MFPAAGPLEFMVIDILGPLQGTTSSPPHVIIVTDRFSTLILAIPTAKITSTHLETILLDNLILPYDITNYGTTVTGPQFVSKCFTTLYLFLGFEKLTTPAYHLGTNGQPEHYNSTLAPDWVIICLSVKKMGIRTYSR